MAKWVEDWEAYFGQSSSVHPSPAGTQSNPSDWILVCVVSLFHLVLLRMLGRDQELKFMGTKVG